MIMKWECGGVPTIDGQTNVEEIWRLMLGKKMRNRAPTLKIWSVQELTDALVSKCIYRFVLALAGSESLSMKKMSTLGCNEPKIGTCPAQYVALGYLNMWWFDQQWDHDPPDNARCSGEITVSSVVETNWILGDGSSQGVRTNRWTKVDHGRVPGVDSHLTTLHASLFVSVSLRFKALFSFCIKFARMFNCISTNCW